MAEYPHCDSRILHKPGECRYCDMHPEAQSLRIVKNINFTGHHDFGKITCPAEQARPLNVIERWAGNVKETRTEEEQQADFDKFWAEVEARRNTP